MKGLDYAVLVLIIIGAITGDWLDFSELILLHFYLAQCQYCPVLFMRSLAFVVYMQLVFAEELTISQVYSMLFYNMLKTAPIVITGAVFLHSNKFTPI